MGNNTRDKILDLLKNRREGLTIKEISESIDRHRHTVAKYLSELKNEGKISQRDVGSAKLFYLSEVLEKEKTNIDESAQLSDKNYSKHIMLFSALFLLFLVTAYNFGGITGFFIGTGEQTVNKTLLPLSNVSSTIKFNRSSVREFPLEFTFPREGYKEVTSSTLILKGSANKNVQMKVISQDQELCKINTGSKDFNKICSIDSLINNGSLPDNINLRLKFSGKEVEFSETPTGFVISNETTEEEVENDKSETETQDENKEFVDDEITTASTTEEATTTSTTIQETTTTQRTTTTTIKTEETTTTTIEPSNETTKETTTTTIVQDGDIPDQLSENQTAEKEIVNETVEESVVKNTTQETDNKTDIVENITEKDVIESNKTNETKSRNITINKTTTTSTTIEVVSGGPKINRSREDKITLEIEEIKLLINYVKEDGNKTNITNRTKTDEPRINETAPVTGKPNKTNITQVKPSMELTASQYHVKTGENITFYANETSRKGLIDRVELLINRTIYKMNESKLNRNYWVYEWQSTDAPGNYSIIAEAFGRNNNTISNSSISVTLAKRNITNITNINETIQNTILNITMNRTVEKGKILAVNSHLQDLENAPFENKSLYLFLDSEFYSKNKTNEEGLVNFSVNTSNLNTGLHNLNVSYPGNLSLNISSVYSSGTFEVLDKTNETNTTELLLVMKNETLGENLTLKARLLVNGNGLSGENLYFYLNESRIGTSLTDDQGWGTVKVNTSKLSTDKYIGKVSYLGNNTSDIKGKNNTSVIQIFPRIEQRKAVVGEPVSWKKVVRRTNKFNKSRYADINFELPLESKNIVIRERSSNGTEVVHKKGLKVKDIKKVKIKDDRFKSDDRGTNLKEVTLNKSLKPKEVGEFVAEFTTPAPRKVEENLGNRKRVTVYSNSTYHYHNVTASANITETRIEPKVYRIVNKTNKSESFDRLDVTENPLYNVRYLDTNNNSKWDMVEWNVPKLSNDTYEISLNILNIQSYPTVGGNWTVEFNTTGKADLIIEPFNGTNWSNYSENSNIYDLKFMDLKCGNENIDYQWKEGDNIDYIFVENYSCNKTGVETSKVLTQGKHHLNFTFGNVSATAHNLATVTWFDGFESGLTDWTVSDGNFGIKTNNVYSGTNSSGIQDSSADQDIAEWSFSRGRQPDSFEFHWYETTDSTGGGIAFLDDTGTEILGIASDNPEWDVHDNAGWAEIWSASGYDCWMNFTVEFDWPNSQYDYTFYHSCYSNGAGHTETGTRTLIDNTNIEKIVIRNQNAEAWASSTGMYMWFDDMKFKGVELSDTCNVTDMDVEIRAPDDSTTTGWLSTSYSSSSGTCGSDPDVTETWTKDYYYCPQEGDYDIRARAYTEEYEPNSSFSWETSSYFGSVYSVNYDSASEWCTCNSSDWDSTGTAEFESGYSSCCGDDANENWLSELGDTDGSDSNACCNVGDDCADDQTCYSNTTCHDTGSTVSTNEYCDVGTWYDNDDSQTYCDACVGVGSWNLGGEVASSSCCGDDSGENDQTCDTSGATFETFGCSGDTEQCCDSGNDCVDDGSCLDDGTCRNDGYCGAGTWYEMDEGSSYCTNCGNDWDSTGTAEFESGYSSCCGDDSSEIWNSKLCDNADGNINPSPYSCASDSGDNACCDDGNDCVDSATCYTYNTHTHDVDGNGDDEYCSGGTWYDCSDTGDCDPSGEYAYTESSEACSGTSECTESCSSNDCIYKRKDGWSDCDNADGCVSGNCVQDSGYIDTGSSACDQTNGAICGEGSPSYDVCTQTNDCVFDSDWDGDMSDCHGAEGGNCYVSDGSTSYDVDNDGDNDYCSGATWYDCNSDSECPSGWYCSGNECYEYAVDDDNAGEDTDRDVGWDYYNTSADNICNDGGIGDYGDRCSASFSSDAGVCAAGGSSGICVDMNTYWIIDSSSSWDTGSNYYSSNPDGDQDGYYCTGNNLVGDLGGAPTFCADYDGVGWSTTIESQECSSGTDTDSDSWTDEFFKWDESAGTCVECDPSSHQQATGGFTLTEGSKSGVECESGCGADVNCDERAANTVQNYGDDPTGCGDDPTANKCDGTCTYSTNDCDSQDICAGTCNTDTGDITEKDYWVASDFTCDWDWDAVVEDCTDDASEDDGGDVPETAGTCTDNELCSDGQTSCPSTDNPDNCDSTTQLTEYYVSGTDCTSKTYDCNDFEVAASGDTSDDPTTTGTCTGGTGAECSSNTFTTTSQSDVTEGCIDSNDCPGGANCVFREGYATDSDDACSGNDQCSSKNYDPDTNSNTCNSCSLDWLSSGTGTNSPCCGDDSGEDFENPGSGNSCCINSETVTNGTTDSTGQYLCSDGEIYGCNGDLGGVATQESSCTRRIGKYCDGAGTDSNQWKDQIADYDPSDDCDGDNEDPYGEGHSAPEANTESCVGNDLRYDHGNGPSNQDQGWECNSWFGPKIAYCELNQSSSSEYDDFTLYMEAADEVDSPTNFGYIYRVGPADSGNDDSGYTGTMIFNTTSNQDSGDIDSNEGTYGDYMSLSKTVADMETQITEETTYYFEIGTEENPTTGNLYDYEDPNSNEGSCTASATLCVPVGYSASTDSDCCPVSAQDGTYPGKDDDGGNCVKCNADNTQTLGGTGNGDCEQKCGADGNCDEYSTLTCPANGYICDDSCGYVDRDNQQSYCEDSSGCTAHDWNTSSIEFEAGSPSCCGDDANENRVNRACASGVCTSDSSDWGCCDDGSNDCTYGGTCYSDSYTGDVDSDGYDEQCSSGTWTDAEAPSISINSPSAGSWQTSDFSVSYDATDEVSIDTCKLYTRDGSGSSWTDRGTISCGSSQSTTVTLGDSGYCSVEGSNECGVRIWANDSSGNTNFQDRDYSIDYTNPSSSIDPNGVSWQNTDQSYEINCTDGTSGCDTTYWGEVSDGASCSTSNSGSPTVSDSVTCDDGNTCQIDVCYYSTDVAGNTESTARSNTFNIDKVDPSISYDAVTPGDGSRQTGNSVTISTTVSDSDSGLDHCVLEWDGSNETISPSSGTCSAGKSPIDGSTYSFKMYVVDVAGNWNSVAERTFTENTKPVTTTPTVTPSSPNTLDDLTCSVDYSDPESDPGTVYFEWFVNSGSVATDSVSSVSSGTNDVTDTLSSSETSVGDDVYCEVYSNDGYEDESTEQSSSVTVESDAPTELTVTAQEDKSLNSELGKEYLTWTDNSNNEDGFKIERSTDGSNWSQIDTVGSNTISYTDDDLEDNFVYYYRVRAYLGSENTAYSNIASDSTEDRTGPSSSNLTATADNTNNEMDLSWEWAQDESIFDIKDTFDQYDSTVQVNGTDGWECTGDNITEFYFRNQVFDSDIGNGDWTTAHSPYYTTNGGYTIDVDVAVSDYGGMNLYFGDSYNVYLGYGHMDLDDNDGQLDTVSIHEEYGYRDLEIEVSGNKIKATLTNSTGSSWTVNGTSSYSKKGRINISYENSGLIDNLTISDGLVSDWHFDEGSGTSVVDASGNGEDSRTFSGDPSWTDGIYGNALDFDGNDAIYFNNDEDLNTGSLTVSFWAKPNEETWVLGNGAQFRIRVGNNAYFWIREENSGPTDSISGGSINLGEWHWFVGTYDAMSDTQNLYVDGELVASGTPGFSGLDDGSNNFAIGESYEGSGSYFNGTIDEVKIYDRALAEEEIQSRAKYSLYASGDSSGTYNALVSNTSCSDLGWSTSGGSGDICGECDDAPLPGCSGTKTYSEAVEYCEDAGARLCTNTEIENDETTGTGCGYDNQQTWTSTYCREGKVITQEGDGDQGTNCVSVTSTAYVRCCADTEPYIDVNNYTDNSAQDTSEPDEASSLSSSSHSTSTWSNDNTVDFIWTDATDNGDDYYYYLKSLDDEGNQNDYFTDSNVLTNTNLDTGWSKNYTQNIRWNDISPPMGINATVVSFENDDTSGDGYWYSYGDYAPQEDGTTYTVSLWVKTNQTSDVNIKFYTADNDESDRYNSEYLSVNASEGWKLLVWDSFTTSDPTDSDSLSFRYMDLYESGYTRMWFSAPQMEPATFSTFIRNDTVLTGLDGYDISCDTNSGDHSGTTKDIEENDEDYTCTFSDGNNNYFHLLSVDDAGNWDASSANTGPFYIDTVAPGWSNENTNPTSPTTYSPDQDYQFNITWTDDTSSVDEVVFEFDGTNYTLSGGQVSQSGSEYYITLNDLA
ncbi:MAG: LamG-like jellyroll fold domain-containing protein, partial [Candidatus Aenigmatarchaeota archaeon]